MKIQEYMNRRFPNNSFREYRHIRDNVYEYTVYYNHADKVQHFGTINLDTVTEQRRLIKSSARDIRDNVCSKYRPYMDTYQNVSFGMIRYVGKFDKNDPQQMSSIRDVLVKVYGPTCVSGYMGGSWSIARIFQFSNSGVVVVRFGTNIGD
jgi:hypothetical protein